MVSGGTAIVVVVGILVGAALAGAVIGAGIDYASGNAGWWGAGALIGLMAAAIVDALLVESRAR